MKLESVQRLHKVCARAGLINEFVHILPTQNQHPQILIEIIKKQAMLSLQRMAGILKV